MIKILTTLLLLSTPAYSATGKGEMGAVLYTSVFSMDYEELKEFCNDYQWVDNCTEALEAFDEHKQPQPQEIDVFEGNLIIE